VKDLDKALKKFQRAVKAGKLKPAKANPVITGLARILVPINFTREARFRHDPAVPVPQLPALAAAAEIAAMPPDRQGFARTQLTRGQNRVVAALRQARRMVEDVL
jgi:hypothetical protein